jgi:hypothetical protein
MSWKTDVPSLVRVLINDLNDPPVYSDDRLIQTITVAARYVQFDVVLDHSYEVDTVNQNISPDPTNNNDQIFLCLLGLKTACIIDQSTFRSKAALEGVRAALGPALLSVNNHLSGFKEILEHGPCKLYADLTEHWDVQNATAIAAILSPFVGNKFDPRALFSDNRGRDLY